MRKHLALATAAALALGTAPAGASVYAQDEFLARIGGVAVTVHDGVTDGCFLGADRTKNRLAASLTKAGIEVDANAQYRLSGYAIGYKLPSGVCIAALDFELGWWTPAGFVTMAENGALLSGAAPLDERVLGYAESFADEVITAILGARQRAAKTTGG